MAKNTGRQLISKIQVRVAKDKTELIHRFPRNMGKVSVQWVVPGETPVHL